MRRKQQCRQQYAAIVNKTTNDIAVTRHRAVRYLSRQLFSVRYDFRRLDQQLWSVLLVCSRSLHFQPTPTMPTKQKGHENTQSRPKACYIQSYISSIVKNSWCRYFITHTLNSCRTYHTSSPSMKFTNLFRGCHRPHHHVIHQLLSIQTEDRHQAQRRYGVYISLGLWRLMS